MPRINPPTFQYPFADVPLLIERGFEAGLLAGEAEISFDGDGYWSIVGITLDGVRNHKWEQVVVDDGPLYSMISDRLYEHRTNQIQQAVREQLAKQHADAPSIAADLRRDECERALV